MTTISYGSQVLTSGDLNVRDVTHSERLMVNESVDATESTFVLDGTDTLESTRVVHTYDPTSGSGNLTIKCLETDGLLTSTVSVDPGGTTIVSGGVKATLSSGLSFDSDDSAIYFGASKIFRIKYMDESPERIVFQYLDTNSNTYVTKFSCAKNV